MVILKMSFTFIATTSNATKQHCALIVCLIKQTLPTLYFKMRRVICTTPTCLVATVKLKVKRNLNSLMLRTMSSIQSKTTR